MNPTRSFRTKRNSLGKKMLYLFNLSGKRRGFQVVMQKQGENMVCKLCLESCEYYLGDVETVTKEVFGALGLKLDLNINKKLVMCKTCSDNLQQCFEFKTVCMYTEDCINSFKEGINNGKLDLTDIYLRKNGNQSETVSKCHSICRLCMEIAESDCCTSLDGEIKDIISAMTILGTWFSDLDLDTTKNPVICTSCNESLHRSFSFIKCCLGMQDKVKEYFEIGGYSNKLQVKSNSMLIFEAENTSNCLNDHTDTDITVGCKGGDFHDEIKLEFEDLMQEGSQELYVKFEIDEHEEMDDAIVKKLNDVVEYCHEKGQNGEAVLKCGNVVGTESYEFNIKHEEIDIKTEEEDTNRIQDGYKAYKNNLVTLYRCGLCSYKTKRKGDLKQHMCILIHKNSSDVTEYSCGICTYKAKQLYNLERHMLLHKDASDVTIHSCRICKYKTKSKGNFNQHMLIHEDKATTYSCGECTYKAKSKGYFNRHMFIHKDKPTMYSCGECAYKARFKNNLKMHMLIHKNVFEVRMYSCGMCTYKAKRKGDLQRHVLIHKGASEITCAFKTKQKSCLNQHMLIHENEHNP